jgi:hypothetical protein
MGGGIDWDWGVWELGGVPQSAQFNAQNVISGAAFDALAMAPPTYNLTGAGTAAAVITHGGGNKLVTGSANLNVQVGNGVLPNWNGSVNMNNGSDFCNFSAQGIIQPGGQLTGNHLSYGMQVNGTPYNTVFNENIGGVLMGPGTGPTPITGSVGNFYFDNGGASVSGGWGVNF